MGVYGVHEFGADFGVSSLLCFKGLLVLFNERCEGLHGVGAVAVLAKEDFGEAMKTSKLLQHVDVKWLGPLFVTC
jgi:hypothetical protein